MAPVDFETLDACPLAVSSAGKNFFLSDALFLIDRLTLPAEAPRAYNVAVPARMV